jgi:hypothetical protein
LQDSAYAKLAAHGTTAQGMQKERLGPASPGITAFIAYFNQTMVKLFRWTYRGEPFSA